MNYIYIDESGNTGKSGRFIIFASVTTADPRAVEKTMRKLWKSKPQYHVLGELHAKEVNHVTRKRALLQLADLPIAIRCKVINKSTLRQSGAIAYYSLLADFIALHGNQSSHITIDKKDTDKKRSSIITKLGLQQVFRSVIFEESHRVKQLQATDFIAWSLGRLYEHGDSSYYDLVRHKESPSL